MAATPGPLWNETLTSNQGHKSPSSNTPPRTISSRSSGGQTCITTSKHCFSSSSSSYERYVFTDPVACRFLEEDPSTGLCCRRNVLIGYLVYIVEDWACSRVHHTFVITIHTGNPSDTAMVDVLYVPLSRDDWSPRLKCYFDGISGHPAAYMRWSPLGLVPATNLNDFPPELNIIAVPNGDVLKHRENFLINENLKRLGCMGRTGFSLQTPGPDTEAKFHQLYKTSDSVPFYNSVSELVKQCQMALVIFDMLNPQYMDGFLCDVTETAVGDWWRDIGTEFYNIDNHQNINPATVAGLLGLLMGARNRLHAFGTTSPKDVFDISSFKRAIGYFQKSQNLPKTRRLDRQTLHRLHRLTAKAANGEGGWAVVPKAVKSRVVEYGGKGGEMVMGFVGGKNNKGVSTVETLDMESFINHLTGERSKWLWKGKSRRSHRHSFRRIFGSGT